MSKGRRHSKGNGQGAVIGRPHRRYDVEMIRDFFEHLVWETRARHLEDTGRPGVIHDELAEQLAKYQRKYENSGLLPPLNIVGGNADDVKKLLAASALRAQGICDGLEKLRDTIGAALKSLEVYYQRGKVLIEQRDINNPGNCGPCEISVDEWLRAWKQSTGGGGAQRG